MTQHLEFLTAEDRDYAAECRRMAALARPAQQHRTPQLAMTVRRWAEHAGGFAARYRARHADIAMAAKQPAYG